MAGIGFELRKVLKRDNLHSLLQAYTLAAVLGSGPWILSMVGIVVIGLLSFSVAGPANARSIGTCWSSNIPISSAFPLEVSSLSAAVSPVM